MEGFTLENMFALDFAKFYDIVQGIVLNAVKEAKIEKSLEEIVEFWKFKEFPIVKHYKGSKDRGFILGPLDELLKVVEDNMMNLQNMAASQFVKPFIELVQHWEKTMQTISEVIEVWTELQKKWLYLEGIFINDDVKTELPDLVVKFDEIDKSFKRIMLDTTKRLNVYECCMIDGRKERFKYLINGLDMCQKSLTNYLDSKRIIFPRFYFLSDDELLGILGASDPGSIQQYICKMFDNLQMFKLVEQLNNDDDDDVKIMVTALISCEEEIMYFKTPVVTNRKIEAWMVDVVEEMKRSNQYLTKKAVYDYGKGKKNRQEWMLDFQGMVILAANQIWWTAEVEYVFSKIKEGHSNSMKKYLQQLNNQLSDIVMLMNQESLTNNDRKKLEMITTIDVHARDVVDKFIKDGVIDSGEFSWESQLRFYWIRDVDGLWINQCTGSFEYSYEYMGLNGKLVVTPLTDRLYLTITQALSMCYGVALSGATATGKTETIKDLAKVLGRLCLVTNCSEGIDNISIKKILGGLIQCGAWGCFDEFNSINESVLSVISTQFYTIRCALQAKSKTLMFEGQDVTLDSKIGIFMTINPDYPGQKKIPESIKSLLRPATCITPDNELICQVKLFSTGFTTAKILAKKITAFYIFANQLLSKQPHYNFDLRSLNSVLYMAGQSRRKLDLAENVIIVQVLNDIHLPKLICDDIPLFTGLLKDFFPGLDCPVVRNSDFIQAVENVLHNEGFTIIPNQVKKIVQLHEIMSTRHSTIIVGPTGGGKSVIIKTLCNTQTSLNNPTKLLILNPKAFKISELYGIYDSINRKWTDGIFSNIFRRINKPLESSSQNEKKYILFDGDVDPLWIENMNSVMDDNKILTLVNQERIKLQAYCQLLFEVGSLEYASPATVSRAGIIFIDPKNLDYQPYLNKWINKRPKVEQQIFRTICDKFVPGAISLIIEGILGLQQVVPLEMIIHQTALNMVTQFCQMIDCLYHCYLKDNKELPIKTSGDFLVDKEEIADDELDDRKALIQAVVIQSCYCSLGAALTLESRSAFDEYMKKTSGLMLIEDTPENLASIKYLPITYQYLYDYVLDVENGVWKPWKSLIPEYIHNREKKICDILVPTTDTLQAQWSINLMNNFEKPTLFIGNSGSAKTAIIHNYLKSLDYEKFNQLFINFSSRTKSIDVQKNIEAILEKRTKDLYGPLPGKRLVVFIDDISLPSVDCYGTQQPIAFLKLLLEHKGFYDRTTDLNWKQVRDVYYLTSMETPVGGKSKIDPRFISLFSIFMIITPDDENLNYIFTNILTGHLTIFPDEVQEMTKTLIDMTLDIYKIVKTRLLPTPSKFHYNFNIRDISKIFSGLLQSTPDYFSTTKQFLRLWRNEVNRVICDRLIDNDDQITMKSYLNSVIKSAWFDNPEVIEHSLRDPLLFGDFREACNENSHRCYEDVLDYDAVYNLFMEILEKYNEKNLQLNIVLFNDVLDHLTRIHRALRLHNGHVLVIGVDGCGKQSIIKLASFVANYETYEICLRYGYNENDFRNEMKKLYNLIAIDNKKITFLLKNNQIIDESFLEIVNNILVTGVIPALFTDDEMKSIISCCRSHVTQEGHNITKENLWSYLEEKRAENLHIVLSMNPENNNLKNYCRNYPGILNCTTTDWIFPWPQEAFHTVANVILRDNVNVPEENQKNIVQHMVEVHLSVKMYSLKLFQETRRKNYITPKHFLNFINTFTNLLSEKSNFINLQCDRLTKSLEKISQASEMLVKLSETLAEQRNKVIHQTDQCEKLLVSIDEKTQIAIEKQKINKEKKIEIEERKQIIAKESAIAREVLAEGQPDLDAARMALNELEKNDIVELRSFVTPPEPIQIVGECIVILRGLKEISWKNAKGLMSDPSFLRVLQEMKVEEISIRQQHMIKSHLKKSDKLNQMESVSNAGYRLYKFVLAMLDYCAIYREIKPKMQRVKELEVEAAYAQSILEKEEMEFEKIQKQLNNLNSQYDMTMYNKEKLQNETDLLEERLIAAERLINGLSSEKIRWKKDLENFHNQLKLVTGDCLLSAGFIEYCGPFSYDLRNEMVYNNWQNSLIQKEILLSQPYQVENQLTNNVEIRSWNSDGLPFDKFSIQNAILTTHASRFVLCIDPQQLALDWIMKKENKKNLKIVSFYDGDFIKQLELAITYGFPIIFQNVDYIDPIVDNILRKNIHNSGSRRFLMLGDKEIEYNTNFKIYLTTKLFNPILDSVVYSNTAVINYTITKEGLENKLLAVVIRNERPDTEDQRETLINEINDNRTVLQKVETSLLKEISMNQGNMLDNIDLIKMLENLKSSANESEMKISQAEIKIEEINKLRDKYRSVAERGALLFFVFTDMAIINPMYQHSLQGYIEIFTYFLRKSSPNSCLEKRIENINQTITKNFYDFGCIGILEKDKLLFAFRICTKIQQNINNINQKELEFFINGNNTGEKSVQENPINWLSSSRWEDLFKMSTDFPDFSELCDQLQNHSDDWNKWFQLDNLESEKFPCNYSEKLQPFQKLMLLRCFRIDRICNAIYNYICELMGVDFITPQDISLEMLLERSAPTIPIIFILSPGADPTSQVMKFADYYGFSTGRFKYFSLGRGQKENALTLIETAMTRGQWLVLENCHLLLDFMRELEKLLESITTPHPDFRLWLTTDLVDNFCIGILQRSIKIVTESPNGLKFKLYDIYSKIDNETLECCHHSYYKDLIYVLAFFHTVIKERRKYNKIGWNINYDFNDTDFNISVMNLNTYLTKSLSTNNGLIPWASLKFLITDLIYDGRIIDSYDHRIIKTYVEEYFGDFLFDQVQPFYFYKDTNIDYVIPPTGNRVDYIKFIETLPLTNNPEVLGLHSNAEINYSTQGIEMIWKNLNKMEPLTSDNTTNLNDDKHINSIIEDIQTKIPKEYNILKIKKIFSLDMSPLTIVLFQELERFNKLIEKMTTTLKLLKKAIAGEIIIDNQLETLSNCLYCGILPEEWAYLAPATEKSLADWMDHFCRRTTQYTKWAGGNEPVVIWLSGLHAPETYLAALVQMICKRNNWPLDKTSIHTKVSKFVKAEEIEERFDQGCYVRGLYIEGARWDITECCLKKSLPKVLIEEFPILMIIPIQSHRLNLHNIVKLPVYVTSKRRDESRNGLIFEAGLQTCEHVSLWILQGVCLLLNLK